MLVYFILLNMKIIVSYILYENTFKLGLATFKTGLSNDEKHVFAL